MITKKYLISELIEDMSMGPFGSKIKKDNYTSSGVPYLNGSNVSGFVLSEDSFNYVSEEKADSLKRAVAKRGDVIVTHRGTLGQITYIPNDSMHERYVTGNSQFRFTCNEKVLPDFLVFYFHTRLGQHKLLSNASQVGVPALAQPTTSFKKLEIDIPDIAMQQRICSIIQSLQNKINTNNAINRNLEEQAFTLFDSYFPSVMYGDKKIGDYIVPKRGKNLLKKNAVPGEVPVVAGGLKPSTYHNEANTVAPVLTISASGANAGYVGLWNKSVWSSDSSYIDSKMTSDVFFWYIMLRKRQKEIFDSQTGSAQPHIYPKHIEVMPVIDLDMRIVTEYTDEVTTMFQMIGSNTKENIRLSELRNSLLPKLMSGELDVSELEI